MAPLQTPTVFSSAEPLGSVRNLQVTDPTISTLNVRWDAAEGSVREYIVIFVPTAGGEQDVVRKPKKWPGFMSQD